MNEIKKLIILIVIILSTLRSNAQSLKLSDTVIVSKSKNELFSNALEWFANSFKSGKDVLQVSDKESGKIIGKGYFNTSPIQITIVVKDNKYRYEGSYSCQETGQQGFTIRVIPNHKLMTRATDLYLCKWA